MSYYYGCGGYVSKRQFAKKVKFNIASLKNYLIVALTIVVVLLLGVIVNLKRANNLREYAIANNCTWTWQGTITGTDADYICK